MTSPVLPALAFALYLFPAALPAAHAQCLDYSVFAWGERKLTTGVARASALYHWRQTVRTRVGSRWNTWSRAADRYEVCNEVDSRKRCWFSGRPCRL
jgi:hypothetical protein